MKPTRQITAVVLLAAVGAVGCSKEQAPEIRQGSTSGAQALAMLNAAAAEVTRTHGEALESTVPPVISSSFADGEAAYRERKYAEAMAIFEGYVTRKPENPWGHYMLGLSAWKNGDSAVSERAFEQALSLDPTHIKSLVNESRLFIDQKRYDEAVDRLTRATAIDPESPEVLRLLGRTYAATGQADEAMRAYRAAIDISNGDAWSMNNLGLLLLQDGRPEEALPLLAKAAALRKDVAEFHNNLGMALEHTGRFKAAAQAYGDALTASQDYTRARNNLARVDAVRSGPEEPFDFQQAAKSIDKPAGDSDVTHSNAAAEQAASR